MTSSGANKSTAKRDWRKPILYLALLGVGFALAAATYDVKIIRDFGGSLYRRWQEFVWDRWNEGVIRWGDYFLTVPVGEYGWILHGDGDLSLFPRSSRGIVSIVAKKSARASWPYQRHVELTCVEKKVCSRFDSKSISIDQRKVNVVTFEDASPGVTVKSNAYMYMSDPQILLSIGAQTDEELVAAMELGEVLLGQIVRQATEK